MADTYDKYINNLATQKTNDLNKTNTMYNSMINNSTKQYNELANAYTKYGETQAKNQQEQSDFAIEKVQQAQDWATQDYKKEQTASYTDYKKQANQYGAWAEGNANLLGSGYAESSQVQMYTAYQNRVATARETYNRAVQDYENQKTEIRLQNNSLLAEIKFNALQKSLELAIEGMQYKNTLLESNWKAQQEIKNNYNSNWISVKNAQTSANALKETIRANKADEAYKNKALSLSSGSSGGGSSSSSSSKSSGSSSIKKSSSTKSSSKSSGTSSIKKTSSNSTSGWMTSQQTANSLGLPAAVNLANVISSKEYETKYVNGVKYYRKK